MVLEHIFPEDWLEKKPLYAFLLGAAYSLVGILAARLLFPQDPALVAVAFISVLLLPELRKIFDIEERQEGRERSFSWRHLWRDERDVITTYLCLFLGILLVYSIATIFLPAYQVNSLFQQQLAYRGPVGMAAGIDQGILLNNLYVLLAVFIFGVLAGDGSVFLITWNASVWGTIFGAFARDAAPVLGSSAISLLAVIFGVVIWHVLLEALAYIMAAISGSVISKDFEAEDFESDRFKQVLSYNLALLAVALGVLLIGVIVETWVLQNASVYTDIIAAGLR